MLLTSDPPEVQAFAALDARLQTNVAHPVALALSGGGDSVALLDIAAAWTRSRGRRLLALTVDHGLHPDSAAWTAFAERAAASAGADWRRLIWEGEKPATGLTAAARTARHALIADAAREAGARVVLFAHTADDIAEADWMRAEGSTIGRLRDWSPSPAWPQGRGLVLFRPLLGERRETLRVYLRARDLGWLDDPANEDHRFGRARARAALAGGDAPVSEQSRLAGDAGVRRAPSPEEAAAGAIRLSRDASAQALAAAVVCAGGGATPPRGGRLAALRARLAGGEDATVVLCGSRVMAEGEGVLVQREPGEWRRRAVQPLALRPHQPAVWDGRFEITAAEPGWSVVPAQGLLARLDAVDGATLARLPASIRPSVPVLIRDLNCGPVLAGRAARVVCLVSQRLNLFLGEVTHEAGLAAENDGETPGADLFLFHDGADAPDRVIRGLR